MANSFPTSGQFDAVAIIDVKQLGEIKEITNQIQKPISQIYGLCLEQLSGYGLNIDFDAMYQKFLNQGKTESDAIKKVFQTISNHHQIAMGYSSEKNYSLDIDLIAQKTNLPRLGTMACLNYLKKEEYIKEINKYEFSQLQIIEPLQNLNIFLKKHTQYEKIIDVLIIVLATVVILFPFEVYRGGTSRGGGRWRCV